ncbi:hypothetical protein GCM10029964_089350 [Kibdelosporangium lantanae]
MLDEHAPDRLDAQIRKKLGWGIEADSPLDAAHSAARYFEATQERWALDNAIDQFERSFAGPPAEDSEPHIDLQNYSVALSFRARLDHDADDQKRAVEIGLKAVALTPQEELRPFVLGNVVHSMLDLATVFGDRQHVDLAVRMARWTLTVAVDREEGLDMAHSHLGSALKARAQDTGSATDLDEAVEALAMAVKLSQTDDQPIAFRVTNFAETLGIRARNTGALDDLHVAVEIQRTAVELTPIQHKDFDNVQHVMISLLQQRFRLVP